MPMSRHEKPHISVIVLNWNTWRDTIECLESLYHGTYANLTIVLVDNHSTDDSLVQIKQWFCGTSGEQLSTQFPEHVFPNTVKPVKCISLPVKQGKIDIKEGAVGREDKREIILLENDYNAGFAKAANLAIDFALNCKSSSYIYILNNDTVVEKNALAVLIDFMEKNEEISVATSTIFHYDQPQRIAIAGGRITPWAKIIHYQDKIAADFRKVDFVSGCALMVRAIIFRQYGYLSERFYYGEEDIEFSWRMNKLNVEMVCLYTSIVYHKISSSAQKYFSSRPEKVYLNALNRLINMKLYFSPLKWYVWRLFVLAYFFYLFSGKHRVPVQKAFLYIYEIFRLSGKLDCVDKATVESILSEY
jgi:GT2 family glycosyltransferase